MKKSNTKASPNRGVFQFGNDNDCPLDLTLPKDNLPTLNVTMKKRADHRNLLNNVDERGSVVPSPKENNLQNTPWRAFESSSMINFEKSDAISLVQSLQTTLLENQKDNGLTHNSTASEEELRNQLTASIDKKSYLINTDKGASVTGIDNSFNLPTIGEMSNFFDSPEESDNDSIASELSIFAPSLS